MQIAPLSLIPKAPESPHDRLKHNDSLIFSITSQKFNTRKQTMLLEESKEMEKQPSKDLMIKDYFTIQDRILMLEQKVGNIKTQYCEDEQSGLKESKQGSSRIQIVNLEFPEDIYEDKKDSVVGKQSLIGKIRSKKSKYYVGVEQKSRPRSKSTTKNDDSTISTKRNNLTTYNVNDFSAYRPNTTLNRHNQTTLSSKRDSRQRSKSFSKGKQNQTSLINSNQIRRLRQQLSKTKQSCQKLSLKSRQSFKKLSACKESVKDFKSKNSALQKQVASLKQKLKKSQTIKERQKQTILEQKKEITELRGFLEQFLKRAQHEKSQEETFRQIQRNATKAGLLR